MSEEKEFWDSFKEEKKNRKDSNLDKSVAILENNGVVFRKLSEYHFRVDERFDYWPSTGKFIEIGTKKDGRGVFNLLKKLGINSTHLQKNEGGREYFLKVISEKDVEIKRLREENNKMRNL